MEAKPLILSRGKKKMRKWNPSKWLVSAVAAAALLGFSAGAFAQTQLKGFGKTVVIDILEGFVSAGEVAIERGTTVVWHNATDQRVAVNFGMGGQVKQACVAPVGFKLQGDTYSAPDIPPGGVASLCFVQSGAFHYVVVPLGASGGESRIPPRGTITVVKDRPKGV